jgi:hypothetical protein
VRFGVALILALAIACDLRGEFQVNTYSTLEAARANRLFERGWVPDVLPSGAGPIVEAHDLDSNARCSNSSFPADASDEVVSRLRAVGFESYSGELPALPFSNGPFSLGTARSHGLALHNPRGRASHQEFAVVADGVLQFWSSQ